MSTDTAAYKGIALKHREERDIREALASRDDEVIAAGVKLWKYAVEENLGISPLAHRSGITSSILSQFFNGNYAGDFNEIAGRIDKFFWRLEQKAQYGGIRTFAETALARALWSVFDKTRIIRRIQIVQGPEQIGKTRAAEEYTERNNHGRTVYLSLSGGTRAGSGDFIWSLAETLGVAHSAKMREKRILIRQALQACDLVILDEAHLLFKWTDSAQGEFWDYLRTDIFANGERGIILMVTNEDMLAQIQSWRKRTRYNVGQLLGRMRHETFSIDPAEDIIEADVRLLVARYYDPGKAALAKLHDMATATQLGHYGLVQDIMTEAWTRAKARKTKLTDDIVVRTAEEVRSNLKKNQALFE